MTFAAVLAAIAMAACAPKDEGAEMPPPPGLADADECGAAQYQSLIGKKNAGIPAQPAGANWRVTCSTCPVTMDFRADRLNIFYDEKTEIIETVKCG
jgi:hypothetical protein